MNRKVEIVLGIIIIIFSIVLYAKFCFPGELYGRIEGDKAGGTIVTLSQVFCGTGEVIFKGEARLLECGNYHFDNLNMNDFYWLNYSSSFVGVTFCPAEIFFMNGKFYYDYSCQ